MKILDYFKMSVLNLNKRKLRTLINTFSISVGVMLIVTMLSLGTGFQNFFMSKVKELNNLKHVIVQSTEFKTQEELELALAQTDENGDIDINNLFKSKPITTDVVEKLSADKRIDDITVKYEAEVSEMQFGDKKAKEIKLAYYEGDFFLKSEAESLEEKAKNSKLRIENEPIEYIYEGRELTNEDTSSVMLPEAFVRNTLQVEDVKSVLDKEITIKYLIPDYENTKTFEKSLKIVGVINQDFYQPAFVVSKDVMEEVKNFETNTSTVLGARGADSVELSVKEINDVSAITTFIQQELNHNTESVSTVAKTVDRILLGVKLGLSLLGLIVISIASLDVINTMIMSIYERTKMIGLMRATGASKKDIQALFLVESGTIGLLGGIVGVVFSYFSLMGIKSILTYVMNYFEIMDLTMVNEIAKLDMKTALLTIVFAVSLTVIAGIYPSIKASRLDPIEAIKHD